MNQTSFLLQVDQANPPPGSYWVTVGEGHMVYKPGDRYLVVQEVDEWLLCWKDGARPSGRTLGTYIHRRYIRETGKGTVEE